MSKHNDHRDELQLELAHVQKELDWWEIKLRSERDYMAPQEKLDLLKKKWAIVTGLKNLAKF